MSRALHIDYLGPTPTDEEAAAVAAAIAGLLSAEAEVAEPAAQESGTAWERSGKLVRQGLEPAMLSTPPTWRTIERIRRRTGGGFYGVVGL